MGGDPCWTPLITTCRSLCRRHHRGLGPSSCHPSGHLSCPSRPCPCRHPTYLCHSHQSLCRRPTCLCHSRPIPNLHPSRRQGHSRLHVASPRVDCHLWCWLPAFGQDFAHFHRCRTSLCHLRLVCFQRTLSRWRTSQCRPSESGHLGTQDWHGEMNPLNILWTFWLSCFKFSQPRSSMVMKPYPLVPKFFTFPV